MVQHIEKGLDITATGQLFVLDIGGDDLVDVYIDGDGSADYEIRGGPNENTIFPTAIAAPSGGTDYASTGHRVAASTIAVFVTSTALSGGETADVYVATQ